MLAFVGKTITFKTRRSQWAELLPCIQFLPTQPTREIPVVISRAHPGLDLTPPPSLTCCLQFLSPNYTPGFLTLRLRLLLFYSPEISACPRDINRAQKRLAMLRPAAGQWVPSGQSWATRRMRLCLPLSEVNFVPLRSRVGGQWCRSREARNKEQSGKETQP